MPAQAGIQYDSRPLSISKRGLDPCLRRGDIVASLHHTACHAHAPRPRPCHACAGRHPVRLLAAIDFQTRSGPLPSQGRHRRFLAPYRMPRPRTPARPCHACAGRHPVRLTASTGCWILEAQWGAACGRVGGRLALWGQPAAGNRNPDEHGFTWVVPTQITMFLVGAGSGTIYSLDVLCSIMAISSSVRL